MIEENEELLEECGQEELYPTSGPSIAHSLGITYNGPQLKEGKVAYFPFADPVTGSTFGATDLENAMKMLGETRERFEMPMLKENKVINAVDPYRDVRIVQKNENYPINVMGLNTKTGNWDKLISHSDMDFVKEWVKSKGYQIIEHPSQQISQK